jgi:ubiquinone/menaquinone biosynthesis C-methylase UbiE
MKNDENPFVCPSRFAGSLDNSFRRWLQNPQKILKPYIKEGMTVLDLGCGPGVFTLELASLVHESGKVYIIEPKMHVTHAAFEKMTSGMIKTGFEITERPRVFFSRAILF